MTDEVAELVLDEQPGPDAGADDRPPAVAADGQRPRPLPRLARGRGLPRSGAGVPSERQADRRAPEPRQWAERSGVRGDDRLHQELRHRPRSSRRTCPTIRRSSRTCWTYFPSRPARAVPRRAAPASTASRDHHDVDGQQHGQPGRDQLRPSDDRGHRQIGRRRAARVHRGPRHRRLDDLWDEIDAIDESVPLDTQIDLFLEARRLAERAAGWILRHRPSALRRSTSMVDEFPHRHRDHRAIARRVRHRAGRRRHRRAAVARRIEAGVPAELAARAARWPWMHPGFDIVELAREQACPIEQAATAYWTIFEAFDLFWLWEGIGALPRSDRWQTQARSALRDDLLSVLAVADPQRAAHRRRLGIGLDRRQPAVGRTRRSPCTPRSAVPRAST